MNGSTYKRCRCRDAISRELGAECPSLHRKDGTWNPRHGQWYFRLDVPTVHGAPRKVMKRGGYPTQAEAEQLRQKIDRLLAIPEAGPTGDQARRDLLTAIEKALKNRTALADYDEMRRRLARAHSVFSPRCGGRIVVVHDTAHAATPSGGGPRTKSEDVTGASETSTIVACLCTIPLIEIFPCSSTAACASLAGTSTRSRMEAWFSSGTVMSAHGRTG